METAEVMTWVDDYIAAWRARDPGRVAELFTERAAYRASPYEDAKLGRAAIEEYWLDDAGQTFTVVAEPVAVQDRRAVVRLQVDYLTPPQEYRDLWLLTFAADGRVEDFEEWAYWPGRPYTADG